MKMHSRGIKQSASLPNKNDPYKGNKSFPISCWREKWQWVKGPEGIMTTIFGRQCLTTWNIGLEKIFFKVKKISLPKELKWIHLILIDLFLTHVSSSTFSTVLCTVHHMWGQERTDWKIFKKCSQKNLCLDGYADATEMAHHRVIREDPQARDPISLAPQLPLKKKFTLIGLYLLSKKRVISGMKRFSFINHLKSKYKMLRYCCSCEFEQRQLTYLQHGWGVHLRKMTILCVSTYIG